MSKTRKKNVAKSVWIFFIVIILIIILGLIVTSLIFKNPDVTPSIFGYSAFIMDEDGMGDKVPEGSLVIAKNYSPSADNLGDAILCEGVEGYGTTVIRLSNIIPNTKSVVYQGFFDNDRDTIINVPSSNLVGRAVSYNLFWGKMITFVTSNMGRAAMVMIPMLILLVCEGIIGLYSKKADKKKKKDKFRKKMSAYNIPENSPLNPDNINSNTTSPVTIDDYIFSVEEKRRNTAKAGEQGKKKPVKVSEEKKEKQVRPKTSDAAKPKAGADKSRRNTAVKPHNDGDKAAKKAVADWEAKQKQENSKKAAQAAERPAEKQTAAKPEADKAVRTAPKPAIRPAVVNQPEKPAEKAPAPAPEKEKPAETLSPEAKALQESKQQTEETSNSSLERLLRLMEEQEKMLKEKSDI